MPMIWMVHGARVRGFYEGMQLERKTFRRWRKNFEEKCEGHLIEACEMLTVLRPKLEQELDEHFWPIDRTSFRHDAIGPSWIALGPRASAFEVATVQDEASQLGADGRRPDTGPIAPLRSARSQPSSRGPWRWAGASTRAGHGAERRPHRLHCASTLCRRRPSDP